MYTYVYTHISRHVYKHKIQAHEASSHTFVEIPICTCMRTYVSHP